MGRASKAVYRIVVRVVRRVYPATRVMGQENLPEGPCLVVGNHAQIHGPIISEMFFPGAHYTWCVNEMMHLEEVPDYAYRDFWAGKPRHLRWLFRIASYAIAPLAVCLFNNARCIAVYRDARIISTFRETLTRLKEGARIVIFPEENVPGNGLVWQFQPGFVDVARMYYKRTGEALAFVPMYVAPKLHLAALGPPVVFDPAAPIADERLRICRELTDAITAMARALPPHTVVPYPNIPKGDYPTNQTDEEAGA